jgi:hypothetical protein
VYDDSPVISPRSLSTHRGPSLDSFMLNRSTWLDE